MLIKLREKKGLDKVLLRCGQSTWGLEGERKKKREREKAKRDGAFSNFVSGRFGRWIRSPRSLIYGSGTVARPCPGVKKMHKLPITRLHYRIV